MASSVFFIFMIIISIQSSFSFSNSHNIHVFPLSHSLSNTQFNNTHHLLKSTTTHSTSRLNHHRNRHRHHKQVSLPLNPGSDYTLSFSIGSQTISLYMDTGSDVVWLPCHPFTCIMCEGEYNPSTIPYPGPINITTTTATPVACKSRECSSVHSSRSTSDLCAIAKCPLEDIETSDCDTYSCPRFYYAYGDGSFVAELYHDTVDVPLSSPPLTLPNFTFGCAHSALAEPIGVAGFGRGALSFPAQLAAAAPEVGNHFSYCLVSHAFDAERVRRPSPLILGRYFSDEKVKDNDFDGGAMKYTPLLENRKHPYFYSVGLEGVSVGKRNIPAPASLRRVDRKGNGGMVVDSGTTFTMLPSEFYNSVMSEFGERFDSDYTRAGDVEDRTGLSPCYYIDDFKVKNNVVHVVPQFVLHFGGNSSVVMPRENYFYEFLDGGDDEGKRKMMKRRVGCVMLMDGGDEAESSGPAGLLGNYLQQGFEVVYDLEKRRVGFAKRKCAALWDSLNQH